VYNLIPALLKLKAMVGMNSLKNKIIRQIKYFIQDLHVYDKNGHLLHTVLTGPPGHGKTEIAKIIGDIYRRLGFLKTDKFTTARSDQLIAGYVGQTAIKTRKVLESALGGVLFLDEIYSLSSGDQEQVGFSKECIDTINEFLYVHKKDIICIVAGYAADIQHRFFAMNKGLERRFPYIFDIEPYTHKELYEIFVGQLHASGWSVSDATEKFGNGSDDTVVELFNKNKDTLSFGGGDTENLLTSAKMFYSDRVFHQNMGEEITEITEVPKLSIVDIEKAFEEIKLRKTPKKIESDVPFGMYT
jgi:SpoVK/Ycf46/Vps4 family AAA+-type ATPase